MDKQHFSIRILIFGLTLYGLTQVWAMAPSSTVSQLAVEGKLSELIAYYGATPPENEHLTQLSPIQSQGISQGALQYSNNLLKILSLSQMPKEISFREWISNALDATQRKDLAKPVLVSIKHKQNQKGYCIRDNGAGMSIYDMITKLLTLQGSNNDLTPENSNHPSIGRFGQGFLAGLSMLPGKIIIESRKEEQQGWRLELHQDTEHSEIHYSFLPIDNLEQGTNVEVWPTHPIFPDDREFKQTIINYFYPYPHSPLLFKNNDEQAQRLNVYEPHKPSDVAYKVMPTHLNMVVSACAGVRVGPILNSPLSVEHQSKMMIIYYPPSLPLTTDRETNIYQLQQARDFFKKRVLDDVLKKDSNQNKYNLLGLLSPAIEKFGLSLYVKEQLIAEAKEKQLIFWPWFSTAQQQQVISKIALPENNFFVHAPLIKGFEPKAIMSSKNVFIHPNFSQNPKVVYYIGNNRLYLFLPEYLVNMLNSALGNMFIKRLVKILEHKVGTPLEIDSLFKDKSEGQATKPLLFTDHNFEELIAQTDKVVQAKITHWPYNPTTRQAIFPQLTEYQEIIHPLCNQFPEWSLNFWAIPLAHLPQTFNPEKTFPKYTKAIEALSPYIKAQDRLSFTAYFCKEENSFTTKQINTVAQWLEQYKKQDPEASLSINLIFLLLNSKLAGAWKTMDKISFFEDLASVFDEYDQQYSDFKGEKIIHKTTYGNPNPKMMTVLKRYKTQEILELALLSQKNTAETGIVTAVDVIQLIETLNILFNHRAFNLLENQEQHRQNTTNAGKKAYEQAYQEHLANKIHTWLASQQSFKRLLITLNKLSPLASSAKYMRQFAVSPALNHGKTRSFTLWTKQDILNNNDTFKRKVDKDNNENKIIFTQEDATFINFLFPQTEELHSSVKFIPINQDSLVDIESHPQVGFPNILANPYNREKAIHKAITKNSHPWHWVSELSKHLSEFSNLSLDKHFSWDPSQNKITLQFSFVGNNLGALFAPYPSSYFIPGFNSNYRFLNQAIFSIFNQDSVLAVNIITPDQVIQIQRKANSPLKGLQMQLFPHPAPPTEQPQQVTFQILKQSTQPEVDTADFLAHLDSHFKQKAEKQNKFSDKITINSTVDSEVLVYPDHFVSSGLEPYMHKWPKALVDIAQKLNFSVTLTLPINTLLSNSGNTVLDQKLVQLCQVMLFRCFMNETLNKSLANFSTMRSLPVDFVEHFFIDLNQPFAPKAHFEKLFSSPEDFNHFQEAFLLIQNSEDPGFMQNSHKALQSILENLDSKPELLHYILCYWKFLNKGSTHLVELQEKWLTFLDAQEIWSKKEKQFTEQAWDHYQEQKFTENFRNGLKSLFGDHEGIIDAAHEHLRSRLQPQEDSKTTNQQTSHTAYRDSFQTKELPLDLEDQKTQLMLFENILTNTAQKVFKIPITLHYFSGAPSMNASAVQNQKKDISVKFNINGEIYQNFKHAFDSLENNSESNDQAKTLKLLEAITIACMDTLAHELTHTQQEPYELAHGPLFYEQLINRSSQMLYPEENWKTFLGIIAEAFEQHIPNSQTLLENVDSPIYDFSESFSKRRRVETSA